MARAGVVELADVPSPPSQLVDLLAGGHENEDPRVRAVTATVFGSAVVVVVVGVWQLQGDESGTAAHGSAASLATGLMVWGWRAWRK